MQEIVCSRPCQFMLQRFHLVVKHELLGIDVDDRNVTNRPTHREAEKNNHFFIDKSFNAECNLTKLSTLVVNENYHQCYLFNFCNLH